MVLIFPESEFLMRRPQLFIARGFSSASDHGQENRPVKNIVQRAFVDLRKRNIN
jgi:hypothetical protein